MRPTLVLNKNNKKISPEAFLAIMTSAGGLVINETTPREEVLGILKETSAEGVLLVDNISRFAPEIRDLVIQDVATVTTRMNAFIVTDEEGEMLSQHLVIERFDDQTSALN